MKSDPRTSKREVRKFLDNKADTVIAKVIAGKIRWWICSLKVSPYPETGNISIRILSTNINNNAITKDGMASVVADMLRME